MTIRNSPSSRPRLWYGNIDFDISLVGSRGRGLGDIADEISTWFHAIGDPSDFLLCHAQVPDAYRAYLAACGLPGPQTAKPSFGALELEPSPWGVNQDALGQLQSFCDTTSLPDCRVVKTVNSRKFSYRITQEHANGVPEALLLNHPEELEETLHNWKRYPCVLKPEFGNSGIGFIHLRGPESTGNEVQGRMKARGGMAWVLEPWLDRGLDIATTFAVNKEGSVRGRRHYVQTISPPGVFSGLKASPRGEVGPRIAPWLSELQGMVDLVAKELNRAGYHGPVGVDSFTYCDKDGNVKLVPLVEINARNTMSLFLRRLEARLSLEDRCLKLKCVGRRELALPFSFDRWVELCGEMRLTPLRSSGILLFSPLQRVDRTGQEAAPRHYALLLCAETLKQLEEQEAFLATLADSS